MSTDDHVTHQQAKKQQRARSKAACAQRCKARVKTPLFKKRLEAAEETSIVLTQPTIMKMVAVKYELEQSCVLVSVFQGNATKLVWVPAKQVASEAWPVMEEFLAQQCNGGTVTLKQADVQKLYWGDREKKQQQRAERIEKKKRKNTQQQK